MKKAEKLCEKIVNQLTVDGRYGWPPDCTGFLYQPERPVASAVPENNKEDAEKD